MLGPSRGMGGWGGDGSNQEALLEEWEGSGSPLGCREESGVSPSVPRGSQEALPEGREEWGGPSGCREGLVSLPGWPGGVERDGRGRESPQEGRENREAFLEGSGGRREGSGVLPRRPGGFGSPQGGLGGSGGLCGAPGGVGRGRGKGRGWEALLEGREGWKAVPGSGAVWRPSQWDGRDGEGLRGPPEGPERYGGPSVEP